MTSTTALFVDTWGWLTLRDRREKRHSETKKAFEHFVAGNTVIITTDFVLDETFTLLFRRLPFHEAKSSMADLSASQEEGAVISLPISPARFKAAQVLRLKFKDKPDISFTDLCSVVVMRELGIRKILTEDKHFERVGFGFEFCRSFSSSNDPCWPGRVHFNGTGTWKAKPERPGRRRR